MVLEPPTSPRLRYREFQPQDWTAVFAYQNTPPFNRYYPWDERTPADVQAFVEQFRQWQEERPRFRYQFALVLKGESHLIGNAGVRADQPGGKSGNLGYELAPHCWGNGYGTEAAAALRDFAFRHMALERLWAMSITANQASIRILEKIGMSPERHLPRNKKMKGKWWDAIIYSITRPTWEQLPSVASGR